MKKARNGRTTIDLRQHDGGLSPYWTASVRRGPKGPILFTNSNASREAALGGARIWCQNTGHSNPQIRGE